MNSILGNFADSITVKLRDDIEATDHAVEAVKNIEKVIKDEIRKGAFISEQQLDHMLNNLIVDNQPELFSEGNKK